MPIQKIQIIESLYKIMCTATSTITDVNVTNNDYFKRRVLGFKAELEFKNYINNLQNVKRYDGGQFINKKLFGNSTDKNKFIYTTLSSDEPQDYLEIYSLISHWDEVEDLYYLRIINDNWANIEFSIKISSASLPAITEIIKPHFEFYVFNKTSGEFENDRIQDFDSIMNFFPTSARLPNKFPLRKREQFNYFEQYSIESLRDIYANRYFLDVILRKAQGRQIIDTDAFLKINNKYILNEVKEKSPIKDSSNQISWKFGWDSRRILWYLYLTHKLNLSILYAVREIDNRDDRNFLRWKSIMLNDFLRGTSWSKGRAGGGGEDTMLAPYLFFSDLSDLLTSLLR